VTLLEYAKLAIRHGPMCPTCKKQFRERDLKHRGPHSQGWKVDGFVELQLLFLKCIGCRLETPLSELGIERPEPSREIPRHFPGFGDRSPFGNGETV
jgi:hypothetical protein